MDRIISSADNLIQLNAAVYNLNEVSVIDFFQEVLPNSSNSAYPKLHIKRDNKEEEQIIIELKNHRFSSNFKANPFSYLEEDTNDIRIEAINKLVNQNRYLISKTVLDTFYLSCKINYINKYKKYHEILNKFNLKFKPISIIKSPYDISNAIKASVTKIANKYKLSIAKQLDTIIVCNNIAGNMISNMPNFRYSDINHKHLYGIIDANIIVQVDGKLDNNEPVIYIYVKPKNIHQYLGGFVFCYDSSETCLSEIELPVMSSVKEYTISLQTQWGIKTTFENLNDFTDKIILKDYDKLNFFQKIFKFLYK